MAERTIDIDIRCDADPAIEAIDRLKKKIGLVWLIMAIARWVALHTPWIVATALLAVGVIGGWPWAVVTTFTVTADAAVRMGRWPDSKGAEGPDRDRRDLRVAGERLSRVIRWADELREGLATALEIGLFAERHMAEYQRLLNLTKGDGQEHHD